MLWAGLGSKEKAQLTLAHRRRYHALANYLHAEDSKNPHQVRAIALRELPNLLHAVHQALDANDSDAVAFADHVNRFLRVFGMNREAATLACRAEKAGGEEGSDPWYLAQSNRGEQLQVSGQAGEAAKIFLGILQTLGNEPSYRRAATLIALVPRCT